MTKGRSRYWRRSTIELHTRPPVGAFARIENGGIRLIGVLASEDGRKLVRKEGRDKRDSAVGLGETLGREILRDGGEEIIAELPVVP